ncbi:MAG: ribosome maturation factor RimM [Flavobacteriales bacterium]|nr:ribosome maturation factor RimM [Flavobacteriales bacterium]
MQDNLKEIGHFSRLHGYIGKLVIYFINENPSVLSKKITIWINVSGLITPFKIQEIQPLNKNKLVLTLLNVDRDKAEELKNKSVFVNPKDVDLPEEKFDKNNIIGYDLFNKKEKNLGKVSAVIKIKNNNLIQLYINKTEILLPYNEKTILVVDHSKKQIKLDIPDGLIELYTGE